MRHLDVVQPRELFRYACPENVAEMPASGAGHFCGSCQKVVVDLSCATFEEAVQTIRGATKSTCVSYAVDKSGGLVFRDRLHGAKLVTVAAFLAACSSPAPEAKPPAPPAPVVAVASVAPPEVAAPEPPVVAEPITVVEYAAGAPEPYPPRPVPKPVQPSYPPRTLAGKPAPPTTLLSGDPMLPEPAPPPTTPPPTTLRGEAALPEGTR